MKPEIKKKQKQKQKQKHKKTKQNKTKQKNMSGMNFFWGGGQVPGVLAGARPRAYLLI